MEKFSNLENTKPQKTFAIMGASGFIGGHLIKYLLSQTQNRVLGLYHHAPESMPELQNSQILQNPRFKAIKSDVFDFEDLQSKLQGVSTAYFLIHMMAQKYGDFYELEAHAAENFAKAAKHAGVKRIIYLGGLGSDQGNLSKHLASRHNVGEILRKFGPEIVEIRASMVIGAGSISFDIVRHLVHKLPILILPKTTVTKTQPISQDDVLLYMTRAAEIEITKNETIEIGGPEIMDYEDFVKRYAESQGLKTLIFRGSFMTESLGGWLLNFFMPKEHARVGRNMVESFRNEMVVTNNSAQKFFPEIKTQPIEKFFHQKSAKPY